MFSSRWKWHPFTMEKAVPSSQRARNRPDNPFDNDPFQQTVPSS